MSHLPIPGFGPGAIPPTHDMLANLKTVGVLQGDLSCFAGRADFFAQASNGTPWPISGAPKYWCNPNANRAPMYLFMDRGPDGKYIPEQPSGDNQLHGRIFSSVALSFYKSRPSVRIPTLKVVMLDYNESGRLSFPPFETEDPMDYPIAEIWEMTPYSARHTFPGTQILYLENGIPMVCTVEEANAKFPVSWGPVEAGAPAGSGFAASDVVAVAKFLLTNSANRNAAVPLVTDGKPVADEAAALVALAKG